MDGETPADAARAERVTRAGRGARVRTRGHPRRHPPLRVRRDTSPVCSRRRASRRDHHPRHRPWRVPALPAEGVVGVAGVVPQDAARSHRRGRRRSAAGRARERRAVRRPPRATTRRAYPARRRDRAGHRRDRRAGCRRHLVVARRVACPRRCDGRYRALGLRPHRRHGRHDRRRHQPERDHDRHQPHRRSRARPRSHGRRHRQPAQQRPRRQGRRRALHLRRARPRDGGAVHQGVLRADRGRLPARARARNRARRPRSRPSARAAHRAAQIARRNGRGAAGARRDRCDRPTPRPFAALLDRRRQRHEPHRRQRAAHQALGALLPLDLVRHRRGQEAHRPVHRAAHPRVRSWIAGIQHRRRGQRGRVPPRPPRRADRDHHSR